ncbi:helix-turn-helix transcriptional regulator [Craterilacuibacter sp.]|uniref:helix-turn-helix transcriptional regulator n=1 Tax=Craterilacuibacter sp. TaxID=2870909 RepID=UPI003F391CCD
MDYAFENRLDFTLFDKLQAQKDSEPHFHPYSQLVFPRSEGVQVVIGSAPPVELAADAVLFLSPFVRHHVTVGRADARWDSLAVNLSRLGPEFFNSHYLTPIQDLLHHGLAGLLFHGGTAMHARRDFFMIRNTYRMEYLISILQIMHTLSMAREWHPLASEQDHPVEPRDIQLCLTLSEYIRNNLAEPLNITHAASLVHMSESSFCRFFKRFFGKPYHGYLIDKKLEAACHLLQTSNMPIQEIADRLAFNSASHLAMTFKRHQGMTPGEYRSRQYD